MAAAFLILGAAISPCFAKAGPAAQGGKKPARVETGEPPFGSKRNSRPEEINSRAEEVNNNVDADTAYSYEFTQPQFFIRHILLEHDGNGHGKITFEKLGEDGSIVEPIQVSPAAMARIFAHWQALRFLDVDTNYQSEKQFAHLGTMRLGMQQGARKRVAEFNWTHNNEAAALVTEYRRLSDQAIFVFDVSVARENQPLNAPKLMEQLEFYLKRDSLSDPQQLVPLLREITTDEHLPLIARNHAKRLLKQIEK